MTVASYAHRLAAVLALHLICTGRVSATVVEATGEAAILRDDVPSARLEAIARARWEAVEKAAGVEIKSEGFVNNFVLLDDAIIKRANGVITQSDILSESRRDDTYVVRVRANVSPIPAQKALAQMARNRAIAVYIAARLPNGTVKDVHALTAEIITQLRAEQYDVVDLADRHAGLTQKDIENAIRRNDFSGLRSLLYRYLTNVVLVGTIDFQRTGQITFTANLDYQLISGGDDGYRYVLSSGHETAVGGAPSPDQAVYRAINDLARFSAKDIVADVCKQVKVNSGRVRVVVDGVGSLGADQNIRDTLQRIPWVANVDALRMGEYVVEYGEPPLYLAATLSQKPGFYVTDFAASTINARYESP